VSAREIAASLTKASKRVLPRLDENWSFGDSPPVVRNGVYSLGWGKDARHHLIERQWLPHGALQVCLTPLGVEVRDILLEEQGNG